MSTSIYDLFSLRQMVDILGREFSFSMLRRIYQKKKFNSTFVTIRDSTWFHHPLFSLGSTCVGPIHSISKKGVTIKIYIAMLEGRTQVLHKLSMVSGWTARSRIISICLLSHYMKDALLRLSDLI